MSTAFLPDIFLYNLTLQKGGAITLTAAGSFSAPKAQEIIVCRCAKYLELMRPDDEGKMQTVLSTNAFGVIRDLRTFRYHGMLK